MVMTRRHWRPSTGGSDDDSNADKDDNNGDVDAVDDENSI